MSFGGMWRRVQSLRERPWSLLAVSDLHLGADLRAGIRAEAWQKPRPTDAPLAEFLDWHADHRRGAKPWRLILNGDIVDFVAITTTPGPGEPVPFKVSEEERRLGLAPEESKCVWKLQRTAERHPKVFDALARFLLKGNSVHIVRGNHDTEWRWPAVQAELRRILGDRLGTTGPARRRLERHIVFHDWFYVEPGFFYAEHGNAHDHYSVQTDFFASHGGALAEKEMELPLSSKVLRYFVNRYTEQVYLADDVDTWGLKEYLDWVLKAGNPLRVAADYFVMVFRVIYPVFRQSLRLSRAVARAADKAIQPREGHVREVLQRFQGTEKQVQQLRAIASRPAEQSLFDSMQLFYLDRMLLAIGSLFLAWQTIAAMHGFWGKAGALTGIGIVFAALNALLAARRRTDAHPMLLDAARRVAQIFDVKYVVMGHSHRAVDEPVGNGGRYFNLGSWTGARGDGFPHVAVEGGTAELRRWKGPPARVPAREPEQDPVGVAALPATA